MKTGIIYTMLDDIYKFKNIAGDDGAQHRRIIKLQLTLKTGLSMNKYTQTSIDSTSEVERIVSVLKGAEFGIDGFNFSRYVQIVDKGRKPVLTSSGIDISSIIKEIVADDTIFILLFYGPDADTELIYESLSATGIYFMGCMDAGRFVNNEYHLDKAGIAAVSFSRDIFEGIAFGMVDMGDGRKLSDITADSRIALRHAASEIGINTDAPDMKRDVLINLIYGLTTASPFLSGQVAEAMMLQSVGGSSGGHTNFLVSNVMSHLGRGRVGIFMLARLAKGFEYTIGLVTCFEPYPVRELVVTKLSGERHILEFNGRDATLEYADVLGLTVDQLTPDIFAAYTLGIEPDDEHRLITSIMKRDEKTGLHTYNDVILGSVFRLFKAIPQSELRRQSLISIKRNDVVLYISFDCILCYLARDYLNQVEETSKAYGEILPNVQKIGFGTFSEALCGANLNQTETFLVIYGKSNERG